MRLRADAPCGACEGKMPSPPGPSLRINSSNDQRVGLVGAGLVPARLEFTDELGSDNPVPYV